MNTLNETLSLYFPMSKFSWQDCSSRNSSVYSNPNTQSGVLPLFNSLTQADMPNGSLSPCPLCTICNQLSEILWIHLTCNYMLWPLKLKNSACRKRPLPHPFFGLHRSPHLASFTFSAEHVKRRSIFYEILNGESLNSKFNAKYFRKKKN